MRRMYFVMALLLCGSIGFGQLSPEEAQKKLAERQAAKEASRSKTVTITQGEIDDMRAELASLRAQVAAMRGGAAGTAAGAKAEPVRAIAVGETRDQVMDFVRRHPNDYEVVANAVSTAHVTARTTISSVQRQGSNSIDPRNGTNIVANQNENVQSQQKTIVEGDRSEALTLVRKVYASVDVGSHYEHNGVNSTKIIDTQKQWVPAEKMFVQFVEGVVSSIDRESIAAPNRMLNGRIR